MSLYLTKSWVQSPRPVPSIKGNAVEAVRYVESDSDYNKHYKVTYNSETDEFSCECPAHKFGRSKLCKHISRVEDSLVSQIEEELKVQEEACTDAQLAESETTSDPTQLVVSFNDGPYKALSWDSVSWLVENMGTGQTVSIRKG